jgi:hypothetical protein
VPENAVYVAYTLHSSGGGGGGVNRSYALGKARQPSPFLTDEGEYADRDWRDDLKKLLDSAA